MNEFLEQNYSIITHGVEFCAAITGLICYKKYKETTATYFILFITYVAFMELLGRYPWIIDEYEFLSGIYNRIKDTLFMSNYWYFTIFWNILGVTFYTLYFRKQIIRPIFKKSLILGLSIFFLGVFTHLIIIGDLFSSMRPTFLTMFGAFLILMSVILFLIEMLMSDTILKFHRSLNFYVATTLFLWLMITTPLSFYNIYYKSFDWNFVFLRWQIILFANVFMYLTFTFALIYCKPQNDK